MLERELRWLVKAVFSGVELVWTEAAHGATYGQPDVSVPVPAKNVNSSIYKTRRETHWRLPIELKVWKQTRKGIECKLRPAQIRYHTIEAMSKRKSAIIAAVDGSEQIDLLVIPGHACPRTKYPEGGIRGKRIANVKAMSPDELRCKLENLFNAESFWGR